MINLVLILYYKSSTCLKLVKVGSYYYRSSTCLRCTMINLAVSPRCTIINLILVLDVLL